MYRKSSKGWTKHLDFIVLDMLSLQVSYFAAYMIRHGRVFPLDNRLYRDMIFVFGFAQVFVTLVNDSFKNVLKRGYYQEFTASVRHGGMIILLAVLYEIPVEQVFGQTGNGWQGGENPGAFHNQGYGSGSDPEFPEE